LSFRGEKCQATIRIEREKIERKLKRERERERALGEC